MPLVLIESPNKISKLRKILGQNYKIMASVGHIMDLSKKNLGQDLPILLNFGDVGILHYRNF